MAKWLAAEGYPVSMVTWDEGIEDSGEIDGVRVVKLCRRDAGIRVLRFFYPRWTSFNRALARADADLYYYNCGDLGLGQLVIWAHRQGKKVVYSVASENDCYRDLSHLSSVRDRVMYRYGLRRADKIIVQTQKQRALLKSEYGLDAVHVPMPSKGYTGKAISPACGQAAGAIRILWVGRITREKRLEWLFETARACPDLVFDVIGDENRPSQYGETLKREAESIANVVLHGRVPHKQMVTFYRQATLLCSTSVYEGFPNVYLEAWSVGLPIVSTFDPDSVIETNGLGRVATSLDGLKDAIRQMLMPEAHEEASNAARAYFQQNHAVDASMAKFTRVFNSLA
jgi:glycosyltransferase involved in cell wall biosynthesis